MVVSKAADHQHFIALTQVHLQRWHQAFEELPPIGAQLVGADGKQHTAADADAAVIEGDPPGLQRYRQCFFEGHAALLFLLALFDFGLEVGHQVHLHHQHAHQDQHKRAEQPCHQVAKDGPYRCGLESAFVGDVGIAGHAWPWAVVAGWLRSLRRSSTTDFCALRLRSMTSRAWVT